AKKWPIVNLACSGSNLYDLASPDPALNYSIYQQQTTILGQPAIQFLGTGAINDPDCPTCTQYLASGSPASAESTYYGEANSQLDLLRALQPKVVTVTIGGDDAGFADVLRACLLRATNSCSSFFANPVTGQDQVDARIQSLENSQQLLA